MLGNFNGMVISVMIAGQQISIKVPKGEKSLEET